MPSVLKLAGLSAVAFLPSGALLPATTAEPSGRATTFGQLLAASVPVVPPAEELGLGVCEGPVEELELVICEDWAAPLCEPSLVELVEPLEVDAEPLGVDAEPLGVEVPVLVVPLAG